MTLTRYENIWKLMSQYTFKIDGNIPKGVTCFICKNLLIEPYISPCGCQFCDKCIRNHLEKNNKWCPGITDRCKEELLEMDVHLLKDYRARQDILKVIVKCPNESCLLSTEMDNIENHIRICRMKPVECPYETMGCVNDGVREDNLREHMELTALKHSYFLVEAINNMRNDINGLRQIVELKGEEIFQLKESEKLNKKNVDDLRMEIGQLRVEKELDKNELCEQRKEINKFKEEKRKKEQKLENLRQKCSKLESVIEEEIQKKHQVKEDPGKTRMTENFKNMNNRKNEQQKYKLDNKINIQMRELNVIHDFIWKLEGVSRLAEGSYDSNAFYKNNYKFCLRMILGRYDLCLSLCIMMGEMDSRAEWPMKHTVTLHFVNQETMTAYTSDKYDYNSSDGNKARFNKPKNFTNTSIGGRWMSLADIRTVAGLLQNDSIITCCSLIPPKR